MSLEALFQPQILVPLGFFSLPVALYWMKKHYAALEKGLVRHELSDGGKQRITQLEAQNQALLERVQNLESIVVALDEPKPQRKLAAGAPKMTSDE